MGKRGSRIARGREDRRPGTDENQIVHLKKALGGALAEGYREGKGAVVDVPSGEAEFANKTMVQLQAERMALSRYTDLMASGGVGYNQIAKEVFFFLPQDFLDTYAALWHKGLAGKDDGGINARGQANAEQARVGKADGKGLQGLGGAKRKTYKKYWVVADEDALALKDKVDKRLRGLTRDIIFELREIDGRRREGSVDGVGGRAEIPRCSGSGGESVGCGRIVQAGWKFCSSCGMRIEA